MELIQEMVTVFAHLVLPQLESCESWLFSSENFALSSSKTASFFLFVLVLIAVAVLECFRFLSLICSRLKV